MIYLADSRLDRDGAGFSHHVHEHNERLGGKTILMISQRNFAASAQEPEYDGSIDTDAMRAWFTDRIDDLSAFDGDIITDAEWPFIWPDLSSGTIAEGCAWFNRLRAEVQSIVPSARVGHYLLPFLDQNWFGRTLFQSQKMRTVLRAVEQCQQIECDFWAPAMYLSSRARDVARDAEYIRYMLSICAHFTPMDLRLIVTPRFDFAPDRGQRIEPDIFRSAIIEPARAAGVDSFVIWSGDTNGVNNGWRAPETPTNVDRQAWVDQVHIETIGMLMT